MPRGLLTQTLDEPTQTPIEPRALHYLTYLFTAGNLSCPSIRVSLQEAREVVVSRGASERVAVHRAGKTVHISVPDPLMSRGHARLDRTIHGWSVQDRGSKNGTAVNGIATRRARVLDGDIIEVGGTFFLYRTGSASELGDAIEATRDAYEPRCSAIDSLEPGLQRRFGALRRVAAHPLPVLVTGESGTGKELACRAVHELSGRAGKLVALNCGAIPATLIESELFGCVPGAFSGADAARPGLVRTADGGTLFLDEVAELSPSSQVSLLRFLQEGEVRPVGGARDYRVDVRIVAATHQDLDCRIAAGTFRADLYARLRGFTLTLPPLRRRREDLGTLMRALLRRFGDTSVQLKRRAARALCAYDYPLNIRELAHVLAGALALCDDDRVIDLEHLPALVVGHGAEDGLSPPETRLRARLRDLLEEHRGNVSAVARAMDKAPVQIRRWAKRFDIDLSRYRA